jgi:hypothetical protein
MQRKITDVFDKIITLVNDFSENPSIGNDDKFIVLKNSLDKFNFLVIKYFPKTYKSKFEPIRKFYFEQYGRVNNLMKNKRDKMKKLSESDTPPPFAPPSTVAPSPFAPPSTVAPSPFTPPSTVAPSAVAPSAVAPSTVVPSTVIPSTTVAKTEVDKLTKLVEGIISGKSSLETCNDTDHTLSSFQEYLKPGVIIDKDGKKVIKNDNTKFIAEIRKFIKNTKLKYNSDETVYVTIIEGNSSLLTDKSKWTCNANPNKINYKELSPDLILAYLYAFGVKTHMVDGEKQFDCNSISKEFNNNMKALITNFCKIINSHPEILNSSLRTKQHNISDKNWEEECTKINTINPKTKLRPFMIPRSPAESKDWKTVIKGLQSGSYVPLAITQPLPMGTFRMSGGQTGDCSQSMLFGGDAFVPQTAPKLSNDVSRILETLLSNLKTQGIDLKGDEITKLNDKLKTFKEAEEQLLQWSLILSDANRLSQDPAYKSQDIMSFDQIKNANRQAELLMKKHAKMQTGFEKVIFAILQNC